MNAQAVPVASRNRAGRPLGLLSGRILEALAAEPQTAAQLAAALSADLGLVVPRLSRLAGARHVEVAHRVTRPPARRPVHVYRLARGRCVASIFSVDL